MNPPNKYCWADHHGVPCPVPCNGCEIDCDPSDYEDSSVNRERTAQWEARKPQPTEGQP